MAHRSHPALDAPHHRPDKLLRPIQRRRAPSQLEARERTGRAGRDGERNRIRGTGGVKRCLRLAWAFGLDTLSFQLVVHRSYVLMDLLLALLSFFYDMCLYVIFRPSVCHCLDVRPQVCDTYLRLPKLFLSFATKSKTYEITSHVKNDETMTKIARYEKKIN